MWSVLVSHPGYGRVPGFGYLALFQQQLQNVQEAAWRP